MREIKFRAWDKSRNALIPSDLIQTVNFANDVLVGVTLWEEFSLTNEFAFKTIDSESLILEQFTGLHDKNGVEIYEGDIVRGLYDSDECESNVFWSDGCFCVSPTHDFEPCLSEFYHVEVIGNIHEVKDNGKD